MIFECGKMTEFYHDQQRKLLIYPRSDVISRAIPESREINGQFIAVPHSLRNSQILAHFNYPVVPVMEGYDWPRSPEILHPYESQKLAANFMVLHPRCFNLSDMGCVAGDTFLETGKGAVRIDELARQGKAIKVYACVGGTVKLVDAQCPFAKGFDKIFRVTFKSGHSIDVTAKHFFMTCRGWVSCANLAVGELLPKFDAALPASNLEPFLSKSQRDVCHLTRTVPSCQERSYNLFCDGQLLLGEDSVPVSFPSRGGFQAHSLLSLQMDVLDTKDKHMNRFGVDRLSKHRYNDRAELYRMEFPTAESISKQVCTQSRTFELYRQFSTQLQPVFAGPELQFDFDLNLERKASYIEERGIEQPHKTRYIFQQFEEYSNLFQQACEPQQPEHSCGSTWDFPVDTVAHIAYLKTDVYYDLHVPKHENYIAHGLCHHNTGKTAATLWAADWLMRQYPKGTFRALIVAPLSILERVWANAIFKNFLSKRTFEILHGSADARRRGLENPADFYIINFDGVGIGAHTRKKFELDGFSKILSERSDIKLVVVDEASGYRDAQTKRHRLACRIIGQREYLWLLTGTPTPNAPTDAYGLAKLVNGAYGKSFTTFRMETMHRLTQFKWVPQRDGYEKARRLLSPSIRFAIEDVWDGPLLTIQQREVQLTDHQRKLMADLKRDLQIQIKSDAPITAANEAAARTKFIQISLGAVYDEDHKAHKVDANPRINELKDVINEAPGKILIFAPLTSVVNLICRELKEFFYAQRGKGVAVHGACEIVNGDVPQKERSRIFQDFQEKENPRILIADPGTMAHGLDLWMARTVVWYGITDKTELYLQANKRAHRPGQKFPVTVVQLVSNALEKEIFRRLETNTTLQGVLLDMVKKGEI